MQIPPPFSLEKQLSNLGEELEEAVLNVLKSGHYIGGKEILKFENSFSEFIGTDYTLGCNSGTDALVLSLRALGIGKGDEVITSSFSFFATAEAISNVGAVPVFVDINSDDFLMNLDLIETAITSSSKAIIPVHLFGRSVDMQKLMNIANKYNLKVIEDCAQASGSEWNNKKVGSWGDVGCFSFFPTKNIGAAGDGGAVTTSNEEIAIKIRELSMHGMPQRYLHNDFGYNSRLDAIQAAILNVKLPHLNNWIEKRKSIAYNYNLKLTKNNHVLLPKMISNSCQSTFNQYVLRLEDNKRINNNVKDKFNIEFKDNPSFRNWVKYKLTLEGLNTIIYYPRPINLQPAYDNFNCSKIPLPITEKICQEVLSLPIFPEMNNEEQDYVITKFNDIIDNNIIEYYKVA
tara:strand:+ start:987 stop:2192 length:1206 start_codon:yes stop_codon:yes gene_type:complete